MHENGISMWFRFAVEPVEQQRPRAVHRGKGIRLYDPAKVKAYKVQLHDLASIAEEEKGCQEPRDS